MQLVHHKMKFVFSVCLLVFMLVQSGSGLSWIQDPPVASTANDTTNISDADGEMVLETIEIKGNVEKPGLIIMPKRVEPELSDVDLERNFEREVKEGVGEIIKPEDEMNRVDRVKSIKKTVERERK